MSFQTRRMVEMRRVRLLVKNVPWMDNYHGREANLVGQVVDAVELDNTVSVAFVDDRDGEASEYAEAVLRARRTEGVSERALAHYEEQLADHAQRRLLHGDVMGVRA